MDSKEVAHALVGTGRSYILQAGQEIRNSGRSGC